MNDYYVSFGGLLFDYYLHVKAKDEFIVRVWMREHSKLNCWCSVYTDVPLIEKPLTKKPIELFYEEALHVGRDE